MLKAPSGASWPPAPEVAADHIRVRRIRRIAAVSLFVAGVVDLLSSVTEPLRAHLHLMSKLSFVLHDSGVRRAVRRQESRQEILRQIARAEQRLVARDDRGRLDLDAGSPHSVSAGAGALLRSTWRQERPVPRWRPCAASTCADCR